MFRMFSRSYIPFHQIAPKNVSTKCFCWHWKNDFVMHMLKRKPRYWQH